MVAMREWFEQLATREKLLLLGGGLLVATLLFAEFFIFPRMDRLTQLDRLIPEKEQELREFSTLRQSYRDNHQQLTLIQSRLKKQPPHFSLVSFIEQLAATHRLEDTIVSLRPKVSAPFKGFREQSVEVVFQGTTLSQTVAFIKGLEDSPYYFPIKQYSMKSQFSDPTFLDVRVVVSSYASSSSK